MRFITLRQSQYNCLSQTKTTKKGPHSMRTLVMALHETCRIQYSVTEIITKIKLIGPAKGMGLIVASNCEF